MIHFFYLIALILTGLFFLMIDYRWKLAFFKYPKRTIKTILPIYFLFIAWDLSGIFLGIFKNGYSVYATGVVLIKNLPIEELIFLFVFCYLILIIWLIFNYYV